jgi:glutamyl-tRNA reductase
MSFVIKQLKSHFDTLRHKEMERLKNRLPQDHHEDIDYLTQSIANKLMHRHINTLKKHMTDPNRYRQYVEFLSDLYELDIEE